MDRSPNQYTQPMRVHSAARSPFWEALDAQLVIDEAELAREKKWLETDVQDALDEFQTYIGSLPVDEAEAALTGLKEYEAAVQRQLFKELGWHALVED